MVPFEPAQQFQTPGLVQNQHINALRTQVTLRIAVIPVIR
jgi:hypothetical protein